MPEETDYERIATALEDLLAALPSLRNGVSRPPEGRAKRLVREIRKAVSRLRAFADQIDPISQPPCVLDPYLPEVLGQLIGRALQEQRRMPLGAVRQFYGSGVYALYYNGPHVAYELISQTDTPIYAGKADPPTPLAATPEEQEPRLSRRLSEHAKSIRAASDSLSIDDFDCRYLVVKSGLQKAAEDYLLNHYKPVWNQPICKGFGKHGDDPRTRSNTRSEWDTLHPGRGWSTRAGNIPSAKTADQIVADVRLHFQRFPAGAR